MRPSAEGSTQQPGISPPGRPAAAALQAVPLVIGQFLEMVDNNTGIVGSTTGSNYYVRILSTLNR